MADPNVQTSQTQNPGSVPPSPGLDFSALVQKFIDQGQAEMSDAQQKAAAIRQPGTGGAIASALGGPEVALKLRQQQNEEAKQPILDVMQRHQARGQALQEAIQAGQVKGQSWEMQQQFDPAHPAAKAAVADLQAKGFPVPIGSSLYDISIMSPAFRDIAGAYKTGTEGAAQAATAEATKAKTGIEVAAAPGQRAKTAAETAATTAGAGKTAAETKQIEQQLGPPAPGWNRAGPTTPKEWEDFKGELGTHQAFKANIDDLLNTIGDASWIGNPEKRAQVQPKVEELLIKIKQNAKLKDMAFLDKIVPDPTKINAANLLDLARNRTRLGAMKEGDARDLQARWKGRFEPAGGKEQTTGSADDSAALDWAKKNPKDPRSAKILIRLRSKGALANNG